MNDVDWDETVTALSKREIDVCVNAAERLRAEAEFHDIPRLLTLLKHEDFFVREAAAWPLAELAGPRVLIELFAAYQRGFDEGYDNDSFTTALLEIPALHKATAERALALLVQSSGGYTKKHAEWLLKYCEK